jgi:hypothetical protein
MKGYLLRRLIYVTFVAIVLLLAALFGHAATSSNIATPQATMQQATMQETIIAATQNSHPIVNSSYPPVDGIYCDQLEQTAVHYHAHITIYINGKVSALPQGVGIAPDSSCYYWLHTHDTTGVIHIESPAGHTNTLGNFLDIWSTHFSTLGYPSQLDLTSGWQVWVDGKPYNGDFHNITLKAHQLITIAYNSPGVKPDTTYNWNGL